eukprot:2277503-Pyramimonas_sp.AAC.1
MILGGRGALGHRRRDWRSRQVFRALFGAQNHADPAGFASREGPSDARLGANFCARAFRALAQTARRVARGCRRLRGARKGA